MDTERIESEREAIHKVLQDNGPGSKPGALLTGWVVVAEWVSPDGGSWLSRFDGPKGAMTNWKRAGMLHEAIEPDGWDDDDV